MFHTLLLHKQLMACFQEHFWGYGITSFVVEMPMIPCQWKFFSASWLQLLLLSACGYLPPAKLNISLISVASRSIARSRLLFTILTNSRSMLKIEADCPSSVYHIFKSPFIPSCRSLDKCNLFYMVFRHSLYSIHYFQHALVLIKGAHRAVWLVMGFHA